ncbi:MAG: 16S rRNA (uracil(1498)-N(3))-methyltransferase [Eubacteriales bacterium]|nr:16S rRNA (uracil(1498)-N(3))-methyltransferase [Eubacteriales bacterium]
MPRFFVTPDDIRGGYVYIGGEDAFHISYSLRMAKGEEICVCDGTGKEYRASLTDFSDGIVMAKIADSKDSCAEPRIKITLYQAYPKKDKMEFIVQKAVELGAVSIVPFESERCIKRPKEEKADKQTQRLCKIAKEAAKQCGRAIIPQVTRPCTFEEALKASMQDDLRLFCYEEGATAATGDEFNGNDAQGERCAATIGEALNGNDIEDGRSACTGHIEPICDILNSKGAEGVRSVSVFVGSEGGFSPKEAEIAAKYGCIMCGLGRRILRCETAPIFALSALIYRYDL